MGSIRGRHSSAGVAVNERSQSNLIGLVLLLGIVILGTAMILTFGGAALSETQQTAETKRAEHTLTLFDSRSAMVALGNARQSTVQFPSTDGAAYDVEEDAGSITVVQTNVTSSSPPVNETIYQESLGALEYTNGETTLAYQGGGVWRTDEDSTRMVSPPEFHYRDATLTLPVIQVTGEASASGGVTAVVKQSAPTRRVFTNNSTSSSGDEVGSPYDVPSDRPYTNPIQNGSVSVIVQSAYYEGWADYFRTRTSGDVTVDHDAETATLELQTTNTVGAFPPPNGDPISVYGYGAGHYLSDMSLELRAGRRNTNFQKLHWSLWADSDSGQEFELHVKSDGDCEALETGAEPLDVSIYYSNSSGSGTQEWQHSTIDLPTNDDFSVDCGSYDLSLNLTSDTPLQYGDIDGTSSASNKWIYGETINGDNNAPTTTFDEHAADPPNGTTYSDESDSEALGHLMGHYFALLGPNFELSSTDGGPGGGNGNNGGGQDRIDEGQSSGSIEYDTAGGRYITFLHITENEVTVELE